MASRLTSSYRLSVGDGVYNNNKWNVKTKVISVIIVATETISKSFRKYLSNLAGKHEIKELQKTAIFGSAHIFWQY